MSSPVFVWVHLGETKIPRYLIESIKNTSELFPEVSRYLVVDYDHPQDIEKNKNVNFFKIGNIEKEWSEVLTSTSHDLSFRSSFWFTTIARFKALELFMKTHAAYSVIHIESDVVLIGSFPVATFAKLGDGVAYPFERWDRAIASILYIGSHNAATDLVEFCEAEIKRQPELTDMIALAKYRERYPLKVIILPTVPNTNHDSHDANQRLFSANIGLFSGVFDGISIGQYLFGVDPRNNRGIRKVYESNPEHLIDPKTLNFKWENQRLKIMNGNLEFEVFNLHIHSKDIRAFSRDRLNRLIRKRISEINTNKRLELDIRILSLALFRSIIRRVKALRA